MALFEGKQNVHLYVRFLAKLGAPLSSELLTTLILSSSNFCQKVTEAAIIFSIIIENPEKIPL